MLQPVSDYLTESIPVWWIWGYWISPMMYAQNAISVNEFHGHSWSKVILDFNPSPRQSVIFFDLVVICQNLHELDMVYMKIIRFVSNLFDLFNFIPSAHLTLRQTTHL